MKLLNIMQCTNLGGMERSSLLQMEGLKARGHVCEVVSLNELGDLGPLLTAAGIPAVGIPYRGKGGWRSHARVRSAIRRVAADVIVLTGHHFLTSLAVARTRVSRKILCVHFHHLGVKPAWQWRIIYRLASRQFDAITFPSDFVREEAEALYPPIAKKSVTLRNPIRVPAVPTWGERASIRESMGLPAKAKIVGNAGWLIARKRFDVFLRTAQRMSREDPSLRFVIAGDGPLRKGLQQTARDLGIADRVIWTGWLTEPSRLFRCIDLLLFNSDWDAMPTTPLEAMAHGVPVVASVKHGGLKELIDDRSVGTLLEDHDVSALASEALRLVREPAAVGARARRRVTELCDYDAQIKKFEALLLHTIANSKNPRLRQSI